MEFIKQNIGWDAEPNSPMPKIEVDRNSSQLILSFYLNAFIHDDVNEEDMGILKFNNCYKYRLGATNDEGFYRGQCRFLKSGIVWGDFYKMVETNWRNDFPKDEIVVNYSLKEKKALNHYLFYFRDETFECIASSYTFYIKRADNNEIV
jgi:hypothetical protein